MEQFVLAPIGLYHQFGEAQSIIICGIALSKLGWNTPYIGSLLAGLKSPSKKPMYGSVLHPPPPLSFGYVKMTQIYGLTFFTFVLHTLVFAHHGGFTMCFRLVIGIVPLVTLLGLIIGLLKSCSSFQYMPWEEQLLVLRFSVLVVFTYLNPMSSHLLQKIKIKYSKSFKLASGIIPSNCSYHMRQSLETLSSQLLSWDNLSTTNEEFRDASKELLQCLQNVGYEGRCVRVCGDNLKISGIWGFANISLWHYHLVALVMGVW